MRIKNPDSFMFGIPIIMIVIGLMGKLILACERLPTVQMGLVIFCAAIVITGGGIWLSETFEGKNRNQTDINN